MPKASKFVAQDDSLFAQWRCHPGGAVMQTRGGEGALGRIFLGRGGKAWRRGCAARFIQAQAGAPEGQSVLHLSQDA
jgi:hypothetical protein